MTALYQSPSDLTATLFPSSALDLGAVGARMVWREKFPRVANEAFCSSAKARSSRALSAISPRVISPSPLMSSYALPRRPANNVSVNVQCSVEDSFASEDVRQA